MTIRYMTMHRISEKGSWYSDTHLTSAEAVATLFEHGNEYPNSVTRILKYENNTFTDITEASQHIISLMDAIDEIGEEAQSSLLVEAKENA